MSTRRARIKAVAVLPPRRKNADADANKNKPAKDVNDPLRSLKAQNTDRSSAASPIKSQIQVSVIKSPVNLSPKQKHYSEAIAFLRDNSNDNSDSLKTEPYIVASLRQNIINEIDKDSNESSLEDKDKNLDSPNNLPTTEVTSETIASLRQNISEETDKDSNPNNGSKELSLKDDSNHIDKNLDPVLNKSATTEVTSETINVASLRQNILKEIDKDEPLKSPAPFFSPPRNRNSPIRKILASNVLSPISSSTESTNGFNKNIDCASPLSYVVVRSSQEQNISATQTRVSEDAISDSVTAIQSTSNVPNKSVEMIRSDILSENTEVSFEPIVPLPSPSKVRLKLRPVPRLGAHRRNSIQGSASESEDESRRALLGSGPHTQALTLRQRHDSQTSQSVSQPVPANRETNRIRNDSVCSNVSQVQPPPPATSPVKEKHLTKARRQEMSKRMWRRRRETSSQALTMYDLIFFNPTSNPIVPDEDEIKAKEENLKEEAERKTKKEDCKKEDCDVTPEPSAAPVPQIKLGPNGEIVLDEASLVIKQTETRQVSSVVREGGWGAGGGRYRRAARTPDWAPAETVRFYRALAALGTDFSLMAQLFPDRSRRELKMKFKKEEKLNCFQVDKALRSATTWDVEQLESDFREERAEAARKVEEEKRKLLQQKQAERERLKAMKDLKHRHSRAAKAVENSVAPNVRYKGLNTADDFIQRALEQKRRTEELYSAPKRKRARVAIPRDTSNQTIQCNSNTTELATLTLASQSESPNQNEAVVNEKPTGVNPISVPVVEELKMKFKKEETLNCLQVNKAFRSATTWDVEQLESDFRNERAEAARRMEEEERRLLQQKQAERERLKVMNVLKHRHSRAAKAVENSVAPNVRYMGLNTADDFIQRALEQKRRTEELYSAPKRKVAIPQDTSNQTIQCNSNTTELATITLASQSEPLNQSEAVVSEKRTEVYPISAPVDEEFATISRVNPNKMAPRSVILNAEAVQEKVPEVPSNIENGSLVVLRVNDPKSPTKTILQTYISHGSGKLTPIALPQTLLSSVMGYMTRKNTNTPKSTGSSSSPILSPADLITSRSPTPGVIQYPSPTRRERHSSYNITPL